MKYEVFNISDTKTCPTLYQIYPDLYQQNDHTTIFDFLLIDFHMPCPDSIIRISDYCSRIVLYKKVK